MNFKELEKVYKPRVVMARVPYTYYIVCLTILLIQTVNYSVSPMTTKSALYSLDLNLNHNASWKKESTWFDSADQSIGKSACNIHDYRLRDL